MISDNKTFCARFGSSLECSIVEVLTEIYKHLGRIKFLKICIHKETQFFSSLICHYWRYLKDFSSSFGLIFYFYDKSCVFHQPTCASTMPEDLNGALESLLL